MKKVLAITRKILLILAYLTTVTLEGYALIPLWSNVCPVLYVVTMIASTIIVYLPVYRLYTGDWC